MRAPHWVARAVGHVMGIGPVVVALWVVATLAFADSRILLLVDPKADLDDAWEHKVFGSATDYTRVVVDDRPAIRAVGRRSASGLYRQIEYRLDQHPWLEWSWRVDRLQATADIRDKAVQDFAAAIFLIFEDPMLLMKHTTVLSYVWTSDRIQPDTVTESPYHPDTSRSLVVEAGAAKLGRWVTERRNVRQDYERAFGKAPPKTVNVLALFTDNDQTREPVEAYYGTVRAVAE